MVIWLWGCGVCYVMAGVVCVYMSHMIVLTLPHIHNLAAYICELILHVLG